MKLSLLPTTVIAVCLSVWPAFADQVFGVWESPEKTAKIRISDCGDGTPCGHIISIDPVPGEASTDINNPDPAKRTRSLVGIKLVWGFESNGADWKRGQIYDPISGRTYRSELSLRANNQLRLRGCFGPLCQSQLWKRVP